MFDATSKRATIRPAQPGHLDVVADIWHQGWMEVHHGHVPDVLLAHRQPTDIRVRAAEQINNTYVAQLGTETVGFIVVHDDEVEHLYVAPGARKMGIADLLLAHGESLISAHSTVAWLAVVPGNARARHFYERSGWSNIGEFIQAARIAGGTIAVPALRYEKPLRQLPMNDLRCLNRS
ncbi:GNAT family N-acetyltransferase [Pinirhizobacter sp.]|uniref:GNAT family N-acetyltransferase n=1 Tax=Pinirhizobacter sp. TaxID=2950432 RepID=UPI002F3FA2FA